MSRDLSSGAHSVYECVYHIEWCPKYRFNVLRKESSKADMEAILKQISAEYGMAVVELAVMPDHIHIVVRVKPSMSLSKATQLLKGRSSYEFFRKHPNMRLRYRKGHFWAPSSCYLTTGTVDLERTREYVRNQQDIHQSTLAKWGC
jgi:putative transposase